MPTRLNPSFGSIAYTQNDRESRFDALIVGVRTRFARNGFINAYYTRSSSQDDTQVYPVATNPYQYYGPSIWDSREPALAHRQLHVYPDGIRATD